MAAAPAPQRFPDRVRLPLAFDPSPLAAEVASIPAEDWTGQPFTQNYEGGWDVVPLRSKAGETHRLRLIYADPTAATFVPTAWLEAMPAFQSVLDRFECPLRSVRLMRLAPGSRILEHSDDLDAESGTLRLHVPVSTNPAVQFRLGGSPVAMTPGSVWYLRLSEPHSAANDGDTARVHLVLDAEMNRWLERMLRKGKAG
ncbi:MAG TPA: aspartyl/asparaginyl beta-hydroxylase domain-containing protein [Allosphingosinicella sp.]|jgi:quercetin dioxygenase-like cupin family protein|nr:aspartyl/asparaginyl beta-hydroxylase domain-containing protein [Allosphingosinicella sp.]